MSKHNSSISCLEHGDELVYGLWDGTLLIVGKEETRSISLNSPATSIRTHLNTLYIGTAKGDLWMVEGKTKVSHLMKAAFHIMHTDLKIDFVVGIYAKDSERIVVTYAYGGIVVYNLAKRAKEKETRTSGRITASHMDGNRLVYVSDGKVICVYDMETEKTTGMKTLLSGTTIDHIIFIQGTEQRTIAYCTPVGKVCVDYVDKPGTGFVFKAHRKVAENEETYYPVTLMKQVGASQIVTAGGDGEVYIWDVKEKTRVQSVISTKKCVLCGDVKKSEAGAAVSLMLATCEGVRNLCEIEGKYNLMEVPLGDPV
ncbi:uncharacterized protein NEMAJ01_1785 [Nematocida major]|uniref:uncharacterized protein n=1 Tax=Nematocida major TaxID=1912982 RepID=UPI0020073820|nr:uncharacterized protein NEMAJ01_1785 [Nematocida major]KAH9386889.1 hypothetical protein NEMAJ01_1785 [Nematocida major]